MATSTPRPATPTEGNEPATLRPDTIGLWSSVIIAMAGSAPGQVLAVALVPLLVATAFGVVPSFFVAGAAMLCIALAFNRLNLWRQDAGGPYHWVVHAVNPYLGVMVGWLLLATFLATTLVDMITIGPALLGTLGLDTESAWGAVIAAMALGVPLVVIAGIGIRPTARAQNVLALAEYLIILLFAALAAYAIFIVQREGSSVPSSDFLHIDGSGGGTMVAGVLVAIFWIAEWDAGIYEAEETVDKERNPGLAAIIAVVLLIVFYSATSVLFSSAVPRDELLDHGANAMDYVANSIAGSGWGKLMAFAVLSSVLATTLASLTVSSRIALSMARDRVLPRSFGVIDRRFRTPLVGTTIIGAAMLVLVWPYVFVSSVAEALTTLINTNAVLFCVYYAATGLTVVWLCRAELTRSVKALVVSGVMPLAGSAFLIWIAYKTLAEASTGQIVAVSSIVVIGLVIIAIARLVTRAPILMRSSVGSRSAADALD